MAQTKPSLQKGTLDSVLKSTGNTWVSVSEYGTLPAQERKSKVLRYQGFETLEYFAKLENSVASNVMRLKYGNRVQFTSRKVIDNILDKFEIEGNNGYHLNNHQRDAVEMVVNSAISILTGGPGTGKTTVLRAIAYTLRKITENISIVYTAPTGKAANRIKESTGENATTLHKKLGIGGEVKDPDMVWEDVIFVDESSMMDLWLASNLFSAIPLGTRVVLVGDVNQLPSVGVGSVLNDLIGSTKIPTTMLTKTFRQDDTSVLFQNIQKLKEGDPNLVEGRDFHASVIPKKLSLQVIEQTLARYYVREVKKYGIDNVLMLLPFRVNERTVSSDRMNRILQPMVNKKKDGFKSEKNGQIRTFCVDDRIMQTKNRPECANGDVGVVTKVTKTNVYAKFSGIEVCYDEETLKDVDLAYAMTIHKSQGSEYKCVIMALLDDHEKMLNRNLVYTGVTRAKKECFLFYQKSALLTACKTTVQRKSFLSEKIKQLDAQYRASMYVVA